jgi:hypothetical protein
MRTAPIGFDHRLPRSFLYGLAGIAAALIVLILATTAYTLVNRPAQLPRLLTAFAIATICAGAIHRVRIVIPRIRDVAFQARIRKFKALKKLSWDAMLDQMVADHDVEFGDEWEERLLNPTQKRRVLTLREKDIQAILYESKNTVGKVTLNLIIEE